MVRKFVSNVYECLLGIVHKPRFKCVVSAVIWKNLSHPNILPFLGATIDPLQLVSEWMPGGTLPQYIKNNPDADRLELVSISLDASFPYSYLH